jgi:predicted ATPase
MKFCGKCGAEFNETSVGRRRAKSNVPVAHEKSGSSLGVCSMPVGEEGLTRLLGRQSELELLRKRYERCRAGEGQVFSIVGEAGIGKSRLLYEFRKSLANEDVTFLEGHCHPYGKEMPYYPLIDVLRLNFRIETGDKDFQIKEKVRSGLRVLGVHDASYLPYLLELMSVEDSGIEKIAAGHEATRNGIIQSLKLVVLKGSELRPVVLAVEDWHWSDKTSEEASEHLLRSIESARVLLIFSYRPLVNNWSTIPYHSQVTLKGLSNRDTLIMTADLLGAKKLDRDLKELVLHNTRGVPFFIEEFIGFLNNLKIVEKMGDKCHLTGGVKDTPVPLTIQDVIMSRVNSLPASAREVLLAGAVAGRQFDYQLIARVTALPDYELMSRLSILRYAGLLYERGTSSLSTYVFKHALIQEACYRSLSQADCRKYHERIAQALEQYSPETTNEHPESLGHHLTEAGLLDRAIPYWQKAAEVAVRRSANVEAVSHLKRALELLATLPENSETRQRELDLQIALGPALMAIEGYAAPEVEKVYSRALHMCQGLGETPQMFTILRGLWGFYIVRSQLETAHELGKRCLALARRIRKTPLVIWAYYAAGMTLFHQGELASALEHFDRGIALYDVGKRHFHRALQDPGVACLSYRALTQWILGYPDQALKTCHQAVTLARKLVHPFSMVYALSIGALVHQFCGKTRQTRERAEAANAICEEHGIPYWFAWGPVLRGWAVTAQGQTQEGIQQIRQGLAAYSATGAEIARPLFLSLLAEAYLQAGQAPDGFAVVAEALDGVRRTGDRFGEPELHRLKGELLWETSSTNYGEVETCFQQALEVSCLQNARSFELRAAMSLSRLWQKNGKSAEARELLAGVYGRFTEGFDSHDLKQARSMLDQSA